MSEGVGRVVGSGFARQNSNAASSVCPQAQVHPQSTLCSIGRRIHALGNKLNPLTSPR
jgi:hypothetical protein